MYVWDTRTKLNINTNDHYYCVVCQCGVIEVVPDSKSRDEIGKQTQVSLREYFHSVYGAEDSIPFQEVCSHTVNLTI